VPLGDKPVNVPATAPTFAIALPVFSILPVDIIQSAILAFCVINVAGVRFGYAGSYFPIIWEI
jgi:hypothetical protein